MSKQPTPAQINDLQEKYIATRTRWEQAQTDLDEVKIWKPGKLEACAAAEKSARELFYDASNELLSHG